MRRRRLAAELRRIRTEAGMSITQAVARLGWPGSKLSRIENRQIGISAADVRKLLDLYEVDDDRQVRELVELARRSKERGWWESYTATLPTETRTMIGIETEASLIRTYSQALIPGLLQTPDYARAVIRAARPTDSQEIVNERVEIRLARQALLDEKEAPQLWVVLNEAAVRHVVGSKAIMKTQLESLIKERETSSVELQILPFSAGEHPAMVGSFWLYSFPAPNEMGAVYIETMNSALIMEEPQDLDTYGEAFDRLRAAALSPKDTRELVRSLVADTL
ncbi:helix-turn-helix domain-containing protein [Actinomadura violacea]|uniref:Helix-turn-helix domain-containing protein n=1 Tax=Actinomadura violacea TaxID=2819934 RepID=A0ABS3RRA7_9ACTN|nr:helix-turn-helix transcriptional regulator [Actinomadura violacea]MBO2459253.1 helix-turn-helix domain-containing protein [Actinomadura violacea]